MKKKDYSSFILILLTIVFVSLCIITVNMANNGILFNKQTTAGSTADSSFSTTSTTTTTDKLSTVVINIPTENTTTAATEQVTTTEVESTPEATTDAPSTEPTTPEQTTTPPVTETSPTETSPVEIPTDEKESTEVPTSTPEQPTSDITPITPENYNYSKPVPVSAPVDDNYFSDALFLGDSLTDGLALYSGLSTATFYSKQALSTSTAFTTPAVTIGEEKLSIIDAMKVTSFSKVYVMLGINEVGYPSPNSFIKKYEQIIDAIREVNPDAIIYIQLILPITAERSETHKYIKNTAIAKFNSALIELAAEKQVYFLNVAESLADETGALLAEASSDGVHLKKSYYKVWLEYLKNHVIT